jgi:hypothetical protein
MRERSQGGDRYQLWIAAIAFIQMKVVAAIQS